MTAAILFLAQRFGISKWIVELVAVLALAGAVAWGVHLYNQSIRDALLARQAAEAAALRQEFQLHADASVTAALSADKALATDHTANRQRIADARPSECPASPAALRAAILREPAPAGSLPHRP